MIITEGKYGYEARFAFDPDKVKEVKGIPGSFWQKDRKVWVIPRFQEHRVKQLMLKYKSDKLSAEEAAVLIPESTGQIPELPELSPEQKLHLEKFPRRPFPFQERGIAYNLINKRTIIG